MQIMEAHRERVLRELRERYAADGLTPEEFDRRVTAALAARSRSELAALVPGGEVTATPLPAQTASPTARQSLESQLGPGEWIEWAGAPDPTRHFNGGDIFLIPFSIFWCAFALFWEGAVISEGNPAFMLWGLPFVAVGLYITVGRFFYKARRRRRTAYAVTNRRVMSVVQRRNGAAVDARYLHALAGISTTANARGLGTIDFDNSSGTRALNWWADSGMSFFGTPNVRAGLCFLDIADATAVAALAEQLSVDER